ncbi:ArsR/SmtB family transcription factor [Oceanibacterium hippocampi]|nr:metalloregulator ArsR/SmtB family transcription factor [Oceanibacterium hippocampi]
MPRSRKRTVPPGTTRLTRTRALRLAQEGAPDASDWLMLFTRGERLTLIVLLAEQERNVADLQKATGFRQSTISQHLGVLRQHGIVTRRRAGRNAFYLLTDERVRKLLMSLGLYPDRTG